MLKIVLIRQAQVNNKKMTELTHALSTQGTIYLCFDLSYIMRKI